MSFLSNADARMALCTNTASPIQAEQSRALEIPERQQIMQDFFANTRDFIDWYTNGRSAAGNRLILLRIKNVVLSLLSMRCQISPTPWESIGARAVALSGRELMPPMEIIQAIDANVAVDLEVEFQDYHYYDPLSSGDVGFYRTYMSHLMALEAAVEEFTQQTKGVKLKIGADGLTIRKVRPVPPPAIVFAGQASRSQWTIQPPSPPSPSFPAPPTWPNQLERRGSLSDSPPPYCGPSGIEDLFDRL